MFEVISGIKADGCKLAQICLLITRKDCPSNRKNVLQKKVQAHVVIRTNKDTVWSPWSHVYSFANTTAQIRDLIHVDNFCSSGTDWYRWHLFICKGDCFYDRHQLKRYWRFYTIRKQTAISIRLGNFTRHLFQNAISLPISFQFLLFSFLLRLILVTKFMGFYGAKLICIYNYKYMNLNISKSYAVSLFWHILSLVVSSINKICRNWIQMRQCYPMDR